MFKTGKNLFLLTVLPVLVTGSFLLWFVLNNPGVQEFILAALLLVFLLLVAGLAYQTIVSQYIDPILHLKQQLDELSKDITAN